MKKCITITKKGVALVLTKLRYLSVQRAVDLGDILCASRFIPAIKELHPNAYITAYLDTEGNPMQEQWIRALYPSSYDEIITIPSKKYKHFVTNSQYGEETRYGALENIPDKYVFEMRSADVFYDMHIDGMKWVNYPFDWLRYFYHFPRPELPRQARGRRIFIHLASNNLQSDHQNEKWYNINLVNRLSKIAEFCYLVYTPKTEHIIRAIYQNVKQIGGVGLFASDDPKEIAMLIDQCSLFVGMDSGLKYLAAGYSLPCILFARQCYLPHQVAASHKVRWLIHENDYMPVNYNVEYVAEIAKKYLDNPLFNLSPRSNFTDFIVRDYKVNDEKSILNS